MRNRNPDLCISRTNCQLLHNFVPRVFTLPLSSLEGTLPCATENSGERHKGAYFELVIAQFTIEFSVAQLERNGVRNPKKWIIDSSWVTQIFPMLHNHDMTAEQISLFHD